MITKEQALEALGLMEVPLGVRKTPWPREILHTYIVSAAFEIEEQAARIAELEAKQAEPAGFVMVPVEPTQEMVEIGAGVIDDNGGNARWSDIRKAWAEMLAAAPKGAAKMTDDKELLRQCADQMSAAQYVQHYEAGELDDKADDSWHIIALATIGGWVVALFLVAMLIFSPLGQWAFSRVFGA